jgi:hypothetical protein
MYPSWRGKPQGWLLPHHGVSNRITKGFATAVARDAQEELEHPEWSRHEVSLMFDLDSVTAEDIVPLDFDEEP